MLAPTTVSELSSSSDTESNESGLVHSTRPSSENVSRTLHTEFGHCDNEKFRYTSKYNPGAKTHFTEAEPPYYITIATYISYLILLAFGHVRDFFGKRFLPHDYTHLMPNNGFAPLNSDYGSFYTRRVKERIDECFSQPVTGVAGRTIQILDRISPDYNKTTILTGGKTRALNISSYNYLGFAQAHGGCADVVEESIKRYGVSSCGTRLEGGTSELHVLAESLVAKFVGMEDSLIASMGFATNATIIPGLVSKGCLVVSDELNHTSIRFGTQLSGASIRTFKHNDIADLERLLRKVISQGQPKTHRPWKKILLVVEGLYSMEGTLINLPKLVELKAKYKFCIFIDEAHSIGALGPNGRGVVDYFGIDPNHVDILMGTFTKAFGAAGGYVAGRKDLIDSLRLNAYAGCYTEAMTPPVLMQVVASMASIMGVKPLAPISTDLAVTYNEEQQQQYQHPGPIPGHHLPTWVNLPEPLSSGSEGVVRLRRLAFNSRYLHLGLKKLGFIVYGHFSSPIVPLLLFTPGKMNMFHRMMKDRKTPIVVVVVAYPATSILACRVRFCVSAAHTKEDIDIILRATEEIGDVLDLKHGIPQSERWTIDEVTQNADKIVHSVYEGEGAAAISE